MAGSGTSAELFSVPKPDSKKSRSEELRREKVEPEVKKETSEPVSLKPESAKKQIEKKSPSSEKTVSSAGETPEAIGATPEGTEAVAVDPTSREEGTAVSGPQGESPKEEAELPESLVVVSKSRGTPVQGISRRETIYYQSERRRDPFAPLTERICTELGEIPLPTFESLKLVGILRDEAGNRALLEDDRGYGYILKKGDKIKNGLVVSVDDNQVVFQIQEYGWSKTIALELFNRISKAR